MVFLQISLVLFQICLDNKVLDKIDNFLQMDIRIKFLTYNRIYSMDCHFYNVITSQFIKTKFLLHLHQPYNKV